MSLPTAPLEMVNNNSAIRLSRRLHRWYRILAKTLRARVMATFGHSLATISDEIDTFLRQEMGEPLPDHVIQPRESIAQYMNDFLNSFSDVEDRDSAPALLLPVFDEWVYLRTDQFKTARLRLGDVISQRRMSGSTLAREYGLITDEFLFKWMMRHPIEMAKIEGVLTTEAIEKIYASFWLNHLNRLLAWVQKQAIAVDDEKAYDPADLDDDDYFSR